MVAAGGVEPSSLDYQSSALSLSYTAAVVFGIWVWISSWLLEGIDAISRAKAKDPSPFVVVDPAGLKPAPHGLKGRCSVTRAPDQQRRVKAEG